MFSSVIEALPWFLKWLLVASALIMVAVYLVLEHLFGCGLAKFVKWAWKRHNDNTRDLALRKWRKPTAKPVGSESTAKRFPWS